MALENKMDPVQALVEVVRAVALSGNYEDEMIVQSKDGFKARVVIEVIRKPGEDDGN